MQVNNNHLISYVVVVCTNNVIEFYFQETQIFEK